MAIPLGMQALVSLKLGSVVQHTCNDTAHQYRAAEDVDACAANEGPLLNIRLEVLLLLNFLEVKKAVMSNQFGTKTWGKERKKLPNQLGGATGKKTEFKAATHNALPLFNAGVCLRGGRNFDTCRHTEQIIHQRSPSSCTLNLPG